MGIQNIQEAKKAWQKAFNFYNSALELDGNAANAKANIQLLNGQIEQKDKISYYNDSRKVWRDIDGDGMIQQNEPPLRGFVFWDKDNIRIQRNKRNLESIPMKTVIFYSNGFHLLIPPKFISDRSSQIKI